jgi:hypothetical protein
MGFSEAMVPGSLGKLCGKYSPLLGMAFDQAVNSRRLPSDSKAKMLEKGRVNSTLVGQTFL